MARTLLLSDVHVAADMPRCLAGLLALLGDLPADCGDVYVLGDLFEVWVGDDHDGDAVAAVSAAIRSLTSRGVSVHVCHGNRDFLMGRGPAGVPDFAARTGARLMAEAETVTLAGQPALLMHGDQLCTLDTAYMAFRAQSRSEAWQQGMLSQPLAQRLMIAEMWRMQSKAANSNKPENIMDVTPDEVIRVMADANVTRLVHGHTHRPGRHDVTLPDGRAGERLVLGDWREQDGTAVIAWADDRDVTLETWRF